MSGVLWDVALLDYAAESFTRAVRGPEGRDVGDQPSPADDDVVAGDCHRYPPQIVQDGDGTVYSEFPVVMGEDEWCGEFK